MNNRGWGLLGRSHLQSIKYKQSFSSSHFSDFMQMSEHKYCRSRAEVPGLQAVVMICWIQSLISSPASANQLLRCMNFFPCSQYLTSGGCGQNQKKHELTSYIPLVFRFSPQIYRPLSSLLRSFLVSISKP